MRKIVNLQDGTVTEAPDAPVTPPTPEAIAAEAKAQAAVNIAATRLQLIDLLADALTGTPTEQGAAKAAIGLLRAQLALKKAKL